MLRHPVARLCIAAIFLLMASSARAAELKVVVTIKPVHALVAGVMAGIGKPVLLVSGYASPHTYAMKPSDAAALQRSNVFFRVSEATEPFTEKVIASLPESVRVVSLAESPGIELLGMREGNTFEPHADHGHLSLVAHEHHHPTRDGHVWLDPENGRHMVDEIARVLAEAAPEHAEQLKENARRVNQHIEALQAELTAELDPVKGKPFVVFHDAYQYAERRFGLNAVGAITVSPEVQPSAKRLTEIRTKIKALGATCVFAEPWFQPKLVDAVIEGTGAGAGTLDPEGATLSAGPDGYTMLLRNLAAGLRACLAPSGGDVTRARNHQ